VDEIAALARNVRRRLSVPDRIRRWRRRRGFQHALELMNASHDAWKASR
jgi:hypothetical protein